jgi:hypothetical protein
MNTTIQNTLNFLESQHIGHFKASKIKYKFRDVSKYGYEITSEKIGFLEFTIEPHFNPCKEQKYMLTICAGGFYGLTQSFSSLSCIKKYIEQHFTNQH